MTDIKPVAWTSKKGLRHLSRNGFLSVGKHEDRERNLPLYGPEAADEITRLRQLLSEADQREREARAKALEEAAAYHDDLAAQHAASHDHVVNDHHDMMERQHTRFAADIRALQSEER